MNRVAFITLHYRRDNLVTLKFGQRSTYNLRRLVPGGRGLTLDEDGWSAGPQNRHNE